MFFKSLKWPPAFRFFNESVMTLKKKVFFNKVESSNVNSACLTQYSDVLESIIFISSLI